MLAEDICYKVLLISCEQLQITSLLALAAHHMNFRSSRLNMRSLLWNSALVMV